MITNIIFVCKRLISSIIDGLILFLEMIFTGIIIFIYSVNNNKIIYIIFILVWFFYFTILEIIFNGRTIGKGIIGIKYVSIESKKIEKVDVINKHVITIILFMCASLLSSLIKYAFSMNNINMYIHVIVLSTVLLIWPVSIVLTGGRQSIYDIFAKVYFLKNNENIDNISIKNNSITTIIIISIILALIISVPTSEFINKLNGKDVNRLDIENMNNSEIVVGSEICNAIIQRGNLKKYIESCIVLRSNYNKQLSLFTFDESIFQTNKEEFDLFEKNSKYYITLKVNFTFEGLFSTIARELVRAQINDLVLSLTPDLKKYDNNVIIIKWQVDLNYPFIETIIAYNEIYLVGNYDNKYELVDRLIPKNPLEIQIGTKFGI